MLNEHNCCHQKQCFLSYFIRCEGTSSECSITLTNYCMIRTVRRVAELRSSVDCHVVTVKWTSISHSSILILRALPCRFHNILLVSVYAWNCSTCFLSVSILCVLKNRRVTPRSQNLHGYNRDVSLFQVRDGEQGAVLDVVKFILIYQHIYANIWWRQ